MGSRVLRRRIFYFFQAAGVVARVEGRSLEEVQKELGYADADEYLSVHPEQRDWMLRQRIEFERREAMRVFREPSGGARAFRAEGCCGGGVDSWGGGFFEDDR